MTAMPPARSRPCAGPALGLTDAFFAAKGQFNAVYTCNAWVGRQLRAAGLPLGIWTPTTEALSLSLSFYLH